jgi:hypothetical protein
MSEEPILPEGPGFGLTFLYYFSGAALVTTLLAIKTLSVGLETGIPNQFGLVVGAVGGLLGASFNRSMTVDIPFTSKKVFTQKLETCLNAIGYTEDKAASGKGILVYQRPLLSQLFSGRVYVLLEDKQAHIRSRAMHVRAIRRKLET